MESQTLSAIAAQIMAAQDSAQSLEPFSHRFETLTLDAAYHVAALLNTQRVAQGWQPVGRKIGFTNHQLWEHFGVHQPIWAPVYAHNVHYAQDDKITCALNGFCEPRIEPEIIFHFAKTPPQNPTLAQLIDSIDWCAFGYEIVQSHYPNWQFAAADTIIDAGLHAALLVGQPISLEGLKGDIAQVLANCSVELYCNHELKDQGSGANVLGGPLKALQHLVALLATEHPTAPIRAGEVVTTGTLTAVFPVVAGQCWHVIMPGFELPLLEVQFTNT